MNYSHNNESKSRKERSEQFGFGHLLLVMVHVSTLWGQLRHRLLLVPLHFSIILLLVSTEPIRCIETEANLGELQCPLRSHLSLLPLLVSFVMNPLSMDPLSETTGVLRHYSVTIGILKNVECMNSQWLDDFGTIC